ncbi:hypothetical protein LINPERHAP2_LOCUS35206 [Linum perenne]
MRVSISSATLVGVMGIIKNPV